MTRLTITMNRTSKLRELSIRLRFAEPACLVFLLGLGSIFYKEDLDRGIFRIGSIFAVSFLITSISFKLLSEKTILKRLIILISIMLSIYVAFFLSVYISEAFIEASKKS